MNQNTLFKSGIGTLCAMMLGLPGITAMLRVNVATATRILNAIVGGASLWTLLLLCFTGASFMAIAMGTARYLARNYGKAVAISW